VGAWGVHKSAFIVPHLPAPPSPLLELGNVSGRARAMTPNTHLSTPPASALRRSLNTPDLTTTHLQLAYWACQISRSPRTMRPPSHKPIPKTVSRPINPDEPSFLTSLPPEGRNRIYDVLFKREEPVLLYSPQLSRNRLRPMWNPDSGESETPNSGRGTYHRFAFRTSLLGTCRQVYSEAAGVLYGANHFIFDKLADEHGHDDHDYLVHAAEWLSVAYEVHPDESCVHPPAHILNLRGWVKTTP
jgi:hypothetical protein